MKTLGFYFSGLILLGIFGWMGRPEDLSGRIPLFLPLYGGAFLAYLSALYFGRKIAFGKREVIFLFLVSLLCQGALLFQKPTFSTDIYRYFWDGKMSNHGINPYQYPPRAKEISSFRGKYFSLINHPHLETIYPPLSQGAFFLGVFLQEDLWVIKGLFILATQATLVVVLLLLRDRGLPLSRSLIYGWNPLVILEYGHSGHLDSLGIFFLMLAIYLWEREKKGLSSLSLSLSALSKYFSLLLLPYFLWKREYWKYIFLFLAFFCLGYLPFLGAEEKLFSSLFTYGKKWTFNSLIFYLGMGVISPGILRLFLLASLVSFSLYQGYARRDLLRYAYLVLFFALFFSPTLLPWYFTWIIPFLCFYPNRGWILLTGTVGLSYWILYDLHVTGVWKLQTTLLWWEYIPVYIAMILSRWSNEP